MAGNPNVSLVRSYMTLRKAIGVLGTVLPVLVVSGGKIGSPYVRGSISAYYYSNMRDVFVALLCMVGVFLYTYRGFNWVDDLLTSISGLLAVGIALFPTRRDGAEHGPVGILQLSDLQTSMVHYSCAVLFFLLLASISMFLFTKTDPTLRMTARKRARNNIYRICAAIMFGAMGLYAVLRLVGAAGPHLLLWIEAICLWAFGTSWLVKGEALLGDKAASAPSPQTAGHAIS